MSPMPQSFDHSLGSRLHHYFTVTAQILNRAQSTRFWRILSTLLEGDI